jgi:hypothetical protein
MTYGYYNMASYISQATGNLLTGVFINNAKKLFGGKDEDYYIFIVYLYAIFGFLKLVCYLAMSSKI